MATKTQSPRRETLNMRIKSDERGLIDRAALVRGRRRTEAAHTGFRALDRGRFKEFDSIDDLQTYLHNLSEKVISSVTAPNILTLRRETASPHPRRP